MYLTTFDPSIDLDLLKSQMFCYFIIIISINNIVYNKISVCVWTIESYIILLK